MRPLSFIEYYIIIVTNHKNRHTDVLNKLPAFIYNLISLLFIVMVRYRSKSTIHNYAIPIEVILVDTIFIALIGY